MQTLKSFSYLTVFLLLFCLINKVEAQHNGDNLSLQGLLTPTAPGIRAFAMGGAYNSVTGDINSVFYNPAGLSGIKNLQVSVQGSYYNKIWREYQTFRPNRNQVLLPFYLEGLITPDSANSGKLDVLIWKDSNYQVKQVRLGLDPYSKEAADWEKQRNNNAFDNITAGYNIKLLDKNIGFALGYNRFYLINYDRNNTYLTPHVGSFDYGYLPFANGVDTGIVKWSRFERDRFGTMNRVNFGAGIDLFDEIKLGFGVKYLWGNSDDYQILDRYGNITLVDANKTRFTYVLNKEEVQGTSKYSSLGFNLGAVFSFNKILNVSIKADLPYTIKREWDYNYSVLTKDSATTKNFKETGTDEYEMPVMWTFGASISPIENLIVALDYEYSAFSAGNYKIAKPDTMFRIPADRTILRFGVMYRASKLLTFYAGYTNIPETFIPDGAADKERGPSSENYSAGVSLRFFFGTFELAYQYQQLKYYDQYYSNVNYAMEIRNSFTFGYRYEL